MLMVLSTFFMFMSTDRDGYYYDCSVVENESSEWGEKCTNKTCIAHTHASGADCSAFKEMWMHNEHLKLWLKLIQFIENSTLLLDSMILDFETMNRQIGETQLQIYK